MLAWFIFPLLPISIVGYLILLMVFMVAPFLSEKLTQGKSPRFQSITYGILSALVAGSGQIARGRIGFGIFLYTAVAFAPALQGPPFLLLSNTIAISIEGNPTWSVPLDNFFATFTCFFVPYFILWVFAIWDGTCNLRLRVSVKRILGLVLNLTAPGLGLLYAADWWWAYVVVGLWWCFVCCLCILGFNFFGYLSISSEDIAYIVKLSSIVFLLTSIPLFFIKDKGTAVNITGGRKQ